MALLTGINLAEGPVGDGDAPVFIASKVKCNIRELEGALNRVLGQSQLRRSPITLELAQQALRDLVAAHGDKQISVDLIQRKVADHFDLSVLDMNTKRRTRSVAFPRQVAMFLSRELTHHSLPEIGENFGGRDHTTVLHGCHKIASQLAEDPDLRRTLDELRAEIRE